MQFLKNLTQTASLKSILIISIILGVFGTLKIRDFLTQLFFSEKIFSGRSPFVQFGLTAVYFIVLFVFFFVLFTYLWKFIAITRDYLAADIQHRIYAALFLVGLGFTLIFFYNNIFPMLNTDDWKLSSFRSFYMMEPLGLDLRTGIYRPPKMILNGENIYVPMSSNYPPFAILFFVPLQFFSENNAYLFMVPIYLFSNILSLILVAILVKDVLFSRLPVDKSLIQTMGLFICFAMVWYTLSGYPFLFTIERGNYDSIAFLLAVAAVYAYFKMPKSIWLQVILLSTATHLKMYPAVLFLILFLKHGKKIILPVIITNLIMLLSLGYENALLFLNVIVSYSLAPVTGVYNHSGYSYAEYLYQTFPGKLAGFPDLRIIFTVIPLIIWAISVFLIIKHLKSEIRDIYIFAVSIPLMSTIPSVSHDYKLIILSSSLLILFSILIYKISVSSKPWDYFQLVLLLGICFLMGRTFLLYPAMFKIVSNKYPTILLLTVIMLINIVPLMKSLEIELNSKTTAP